MKKSRAAAICAAFALSMSLLCTVAFAVEEPKEPHTPAIAATESAIPEEPTAAPDSAEAAETPESGMAAPPAGTGTVIETATEEDGREFYTITTPENNVFYLVIDRSRQTENVYFLDAVTEKDLLALAEKSGESIAETEATALEAEMQPPAPQEMQAGQEAAEEEQSGVPVNLIVVLAAAAAFGIGAWYFKVYRKRREAVETQDEYEADSLPEQDYEEYGEEPDDAPPWDEDETDGEDEEENE